MLSFYIKIDYRIGHNSSDVALVYGGISNDLPRENRKVRIKGSIIASQHCEIATGRRLI
jgi:cytochrome c-type biogenesis protein CcmE